MVALSIVWLHRADRVVLPARQEVRLLTRDPAAARSSFGEYVTPVDGHVGAPCTL